MPPIPREGPARRAWLASLQYVVAMDAAATAEQIAEEFDASPDEIEPMILGLAVYLFHVIADAVLLGADLWEATAA